VTTADKGARVATAEEVTLVTGAILKQWPVALDALRAGRPYPQPGPPADKVARRCRAEHVRSPRCLAVSLRRASAISWRGAGGSGRGSASTRRTALAPGKGPLPPPHRGGGLGRCDQRCKRGKPPVEPPDRLPEPSLRSRPFGPAATGPGNPGAAANPGPATGKPSVIKGWICVFRARSISRFHNCISTTGLTPAAIRRTYVASMDPSCEAGGLGEEERQPARRWGVIRC
jgi:hypothetical protein